MASSSSPSPQQQFCLRWNNHQSALVSVFDHLLQSEAFVDVTLAVEGLLLRAHKLVLSACSPYFQTVFASHPAKHPIIILKDVRYSDLRALLDFMYKGEVAIDQDRLPGFLRLAESLKIRGLAEFCQEEASAASAAAAVAQQCIGSDQPPIFDSLAALSDPQRRLNHQPVAPAPAIAPTAATNATAGAGSTAVELLPLSSQLAGLGRRSADLSALDFSVPTALGIFGSPLALTARSNSSLGSSSVGSKRPNSPQLQTYAHHRRKRGRPPRHSNPDYVGSSNAVGLKSMVNKDVRGSPEVMEMNVDLMSMGVNVAMNDTNSQPTNSTAHDSSSVAQDDDKDTKTTSRNSSPSPTAERPSSVPSDPTLLAPDTRPDQVDGADSQPGASPLTEFARRITGQVGKGNKRMRGRPRSHSHRMGDRPSSELGGDSDLAGPSSQTDSPDRSGLNSGATNSNNTEQLQEMSIRGLNLFRYASVSEEGMYRCIPCEKDHVTRTFKNKYSFQRHAYLYHEGNQRKVFPCLVCGREFSRPDKLKHHLKTVHDYAVPREYSNAYYALP